MFPRSLPSMPKLDLLQHLWRSNIPECQFRSVPWLRNIKLCCLRELNSLPRMRKGRLLHWGGKMQAMWQTHVLDVVRQMLFDCGVVPSWILEVRDHFGCRLDSSIGDCLHDVESLLALETKNKDRAAVQKRRSEWERLVHEWGRSNQLLMFIMNNIWEFVLSCFYLSVPWSFEAILNDFSLSWD